MVAPFRFAHKFCLILAFVLLACSGTTAQERLCDPSFEDCYAPLLQAVQAETVGIDMAFYWIELPELADAVIKRYQSGVPVRITIEARASKKFPGNQCFLSNAEGVS